MKASIVALVVTAAFAAIARTAARRCGARAAATRSAVGAIAAGPPISALLPGPHGAAVAGVLAVCAACVSAGTDFRYGLIFDAVVYSALGALLLRSLQTGTYEAAIAGCALLCGVLGLLRLLTCGRGIGFGDVKFAGVAGAAFGCGWGLTALGAAFVCGGAVAAVLLALGIANRKTPIPFAPFLAIGCAFAGIMGGSLS